MAAQGFPVADELDAVQAGCNAAVAVGVIGVEVHGHAGVAAGIEQGSIHRIRVLIHHVGLFVRLGGDEPAAGVGGIIRTLQVTVAQGAANRLEGRQWSQAGEGQSRNFAKEYERTLNFTQIICD